MGAKTRSSIWWSQGPSKAVQTQSGESGFSVLEAMIAMALLAAALLPLLNLQAQFTRTVNSLERADRRLEVRHVALNKIKTINPAIEPRGEYEHLESQVKWTSRPVLPLETIYDAGSPGVHDVGLYDVSVAISFSDGSSDQFTMRRLAWRRQDNQHSIFD